MPDQKPPLTEEEVQWVRDGYKRTKDCRTWSRDLMFGVVKWLIMGFFGALGWLVLSGAKEWTRIWLQ